MLPLESPHLGDSSEYTQYIIHNIKKKIILNELSVVKQLKFYCIQMILYGACTMSTPWYNFIVTVLVKYPCSHSYIYLLRLTGTA